MIKNTCQVCESLVYPDGRQPVTCEEGGEPFKYEVDVFLSVGEWGRSIVICDGCAQRLILEIESFIHDSWAFREMTLGELQERLDSVASEDACPSWEPLPQEKPPLEAIAEIWAKFTLGERKEAAQLLRTILKSEGL